MSKREYEDKTHRMDCSFRWESEEDCKANGYGCTCEREARIQKLREAGDPVWN